MEVVSVEKRTCLYCNRELTGRSDKRFCDDGCRNNYNYQRNKRNNDVINKTNKSLLYNRNILKSIVKHGKRIVKKQLLVEKQFDFDVITGIRKTSKLYEYNLLYDYAYRCINEDDVLIVKYC